MGYIDLVIAFFHIGLFTIGGGYAMIPLIRDLIVKNGWMTASEFVDIIAIAEMTPGPIAVNTATFVGYRTLGILGGVAATVGVVLPSLIIIVAISHALFKIREHPTIKSVLLGLRPALAGLVGSSAFYVARTTIMRGAGPFEINVPSIVIAVGVILSMTKFKLHPIAAIIGSGIAGVIVF